MVLNQITSTPNVKLLEIFSIGFLKQTLLRSSYDSFLSFNMYISLPRHLTCLFFILLLVMTICELKVGYKG